MLRAAEAVPSSSVDLKGTHMKKINLKNSARVSASAVLRGRLFAVLTLLLAFGVIPASANNVCSNATLEGDYGFTILGDQPKPDGTTSPVKGIAIVHFDGAGNLTQKDFVMNSGVPTPGHGDSQTGFHFQTGETGTYTVNADCTGSAEIDLNVPVPSGSTGVIKLMLVVTNGGRAIHTVVAEITPPGATKPILDTTRSDAWKIGSDQD